MCGISGFVRTGNNTVATWPMIRATFQNIQIRGTDAAGFAALTDDGVWLDKAPEPSGRFAKRPVVQKYVNAGELAIFHARYATHGDPADNKTNHPFWTNDGRYVMVHNGVIHDNPDGMETPNGVDSEIALGMIAEYGVHGAAERMSTWRNSSYAILVIDTHEEALYAFRNEHRPLVFANMYETLGGYVLASTEQIMESAMKRVGTWGDIIGTVPFSVYEFKSGVTNITPTRLSRFDKWLNYANAMNGKKYHTDRAARIAAHGGAHTSGR